jgi:RNA recognition motif-containing protein
MVHFGVKLNPSSAATELTHYKKIGQLKIQNLIKLPGEAQRTQFESLIEHFARCLDWSEFNVNFYSNQSQDHVTAFVTFANNDDHMEFLKIFDNMPFNGKRLVVKPNGFTDSQFNASTSGVRFREQLYAIGEFNSFFYFSFGKCSSAMANAIENRIKSTHQSDENNNENADDCFIIEIDNSKRLRESDSTESLSALCLNKKSKQQIEGKEKNEKTLGRFERFDHLDDDSDNSDSDDSSD